MDKEIITLQQVKEMGEKFGTAQTDTKIKAQFADVLEKLSNEDADSAEFSDLVKLLAMPEDVFAVLAPVFLEEMSKSANSTTDRLSIVQMMNASGMTAMDAQNQYLELCDELDSEDIASVLSEQKRSFLKELLGVTYNIMQETEGVAKKIINIPIELINPDAKLPEYAHDTDAGMDVFAIEDVDIAPGETKIIPTGIKVAIPRGYELQVRPKSGRSAKSKLRIANAPGTIDAGYRDEIGIIAENTDQFIKSANVDSNGYVCAPLFGSSIHIDKGEKIAQLVLCSVTNANWIKVDTLTTDGDRGGGFGSTGLI